MWIFFFKQKTAYEMRISDWSSDVCSSDLGVDGRPVEAQNAGRLVQGRPPIHGELDDRDVHHPDQGEDGGGAIAALAVLEGVQQRHVAEIEEEQDEHRGEAAVPLPPGAPHRPTRSEEHTSELPSLMRISYAVFCLKK